MLILLMRRSLCRLSSCDTVSEVHVDLEKFSGSIMAAIQNGFKELIATVLPTSIHQHIQLEIVLDSTRLDKYYYRV